MADSDRDLSLLADILDVYVKQMRGGMRPKFLYLPPGGIVSLADDLASLCPSEEHADGFPTFCGMRIIERPDIDCRGYRALLRDAPLEGH